MFFKIGSNALNRQISRQASLAFHVLYRGEADRIQVTDSMDSSINHRQGIITGYDEFKHAFIVRLNTRFVSKASFFTGEKRLIEAKFLQPIPYIRYDYEQKLRIYGELRTAIPPLPTSFSAIVTAISPVEGCIHYTTIPIVKSILDVIKSSNPCMNDLSFSMIRPLIDTFRSQDQTKHVVTHPIESNDTSDSIESAKTTQEAMFIQYPDTDRCSVVSCAYCDTQEICDHHGVCNSCNSRSKPLCEITRKSFGEQFMDSSNVDPDLFLKPDNLRFVLPFYTTGASLLSASIQLNEMNVARTIQVVPSEEDIYNALSSIPISVTNRDLYSLFPHERITDSIIDLCSFW